MQVRSLPNQFLSIPDYAFAFGVPAQVGQDKSNRLQRDSSDVTR